MDKYNLQRFLDVQKYNYDIALEELKNGEKQSHWIWFIFPQLKGLGQSYMSIYYGIENLEEAIEYSKNETLWNRYIELCNVLLSLKDKSIFEILGYIDALKFCSSLTLFYKATNNNLLLELLDKYYQCKMDKKTIKILESK